MSADKKKSSPKGAKTNISTKIIPQIRRNVNMSTPIEKLALSTRALNCAKRFGINTAEELAERIDEFCKHSPRHGKQAREVLRIREINMRLEDK